MKGRRTKDPIPIRSEENEADEHLDAYEKTCSRLWEAKLDRLPITLDFEQLLEETNLSKSKYFELVKPEHENFDPKCPRGFPLYDSERSPRVWWSHRVIAWLMHRDEQHR